MFAVSCGVAANINICSSVLCVQLRCDTNSDYHTCPVAATPQNIVKTVSCDFGTTGECMFLSVSAKSAGGLERDNLVILSMEWYV